MTARDLKRIADLLRMMNSPNQGECDNARRKLDALLQRLGKTWNDLPELLAQTVTPSQAPPPDPRDTSPPDSPFEAFTPAETVRGIVEKYVALEPHEYVAVALWIVHTHIYDRYMVTPRLVLTSPVRNCGKSTLLDVASRLVARPYKDDNITAAAIYHIISTTKSTLLLDEADNLELSTTATLRAVLNAGYRKGGSISRVVKGALKRFSVFAPVALTPIGLLTRPLMSRSIVIHMRRHDGARPLRYFVDTDTADLDIVYSHIKRFVRQIESGQVVLDPDPAMPMGIRGRRADNWRPLLAIADACNPAWGKLARDAATTFARGGERDEDVGIVLLRHVREIFDARAVDRFSSKKLVEELINLDEADGTWAEYRGITGSERPRKLTQNTLAALLTPFGIHPKRMWPPLRTRTTMGYRGYLRADFEPAWRAYCDEGATPPQRDGIRHLRSVP